MENINKNLDIDNLFDNLIKEGYLEEELEVAKGFTVKVRPLNTGELYSADAEISRANPNIPPDITAKLRICKILAKAIVSLNGVPIKREGESHEEEVVRRTALYNNLTKLPLYISSKAYNFYLTVCAKENELYKTPEKISEEIENF